MSLLDLQGMTSPVEEMEFGGRSYGGGHSTPSTLSVTLCGGPSGLSLLLCHK